MKKINLLISVVFSVATVFSLGSCASTSSSNVQRVSSDTVTDYSGYWNDTDVKIVAETLVGECLNSNAVVAFNAVKKKTSSCYSWNFRK